MHHLLQPYWLFSWYVSTVAWWPLAWLAWLLTILNTYTAAFILYVRISLKKLPWLVEFQFNIRLQTLYLWELSRCRLPRQMVGLCCNSSCVLPENRYGIGLADCCLQWCQQSPFIIMGYTWEETFTFDPDNGCILFHNLINHHHKMKWGLLG